MPTFDEREHLVREFRTNTGASDTHARDVLSRNRWNLANSYKEVEQMCITSNRTSMGPTPTVPPPPYPQQQVGTRPVAAPSRGGMEGGVGPAVSLDTRGVRPAGRVIPGESGPQVHPVEGLKVMLPPVKAAAERVIPIQVEGGRTVYQAQSGGATDPTSASAAVSRIALDEKVLPSQPVMVPPKMSSSSSSTTTTNSSNKPQPQSTVPSTQTPLPSHPIEGYPRLKRGFSSIAENEILVTAARSSVLQDIKEDNHSHMFQTFMLPDFSMHPEDFRAFLIKQLIESSTLTSLESAGRLNWWAHQGLCQRLFPMATTGDGNCLLHAASLSMWGIHDRLLTLRNALHDTLTSATYKDNLYRRWRWQQTQVNLQSGLVFSEEEWKTEWENILRLASPSPRSCPDSGVNANSCCDSPLTCSSSSTDPVVYESLEEFHVFVLAHVLQRPIIVVADTILHDANGEALAPIPFGGIYLPLERPRSHCCSTPLLLTYDAAHFSALVPMEHDKSAYDASVPLAIPVVDPELKLLPLHFCYDPGPKFDWKSANNKDMPSEPCLEDRLNLLKAYLDIVQLSSDATLIGNPQVTTSRQSSSGSEDGSTLNLLKEKRKDGKPNTVAKQFGSLGKTMGKKLKNLGNNLAPSKPGAKSGGQDGDKGTLVSLGSGLTHSTKVITALATTGSGENEEVVPCAKLACEFDDTREVFIENYLKNAEKCFLQEQELKRQQGEEQRSRMAPHSSTTPLSQRNLCRTIGCNNYALPNISLCDLCASQQQWQPSGTLDRSHARLQDQPSGYNTFPGRHKAPTGLPSNTATSHEIYKCGKSKFYAPTHPDPPLAPSTLQVLRHGDRQQSMSTGNVARGMPAQRPRSPSPDYDNAPRVKETNPKCATEGCDFYGSKDMGNLCSGCYRKKHQQQHYARTEKTTKL